MTRVPAEVGRNTRIVTAKICDKKQSNNHTMEKEYYIVVNDHREGPFSFEQLRERSLEPSTLVWTAGLADWVRADTLPELAPILSVRTRIDEQESAFGTYARPVVPTNPAQGNSGAVGGKPYGCSSCGSSNNWYTLAIIATVLGFLFSCIGGILGIIAICKGNEAKKAERAGDDYTAQSKWSTCKTMTIVSFVLTGIGLIANITVLSSLLNNPALTGL